MSYTDNIPLRLSTEWAKYPAVYPLPVVYGRVTLKPQPYDESGALWLIAGHAIQGVDAVTVDGQKTDAYALQNGVDEIGKPVSVVEIANPVDSRDKITVSVRGKMHPDSGVLLDRPDLVLYDWLVNVCGQPFDVADFDELRTWSQNNSVVVGGVIDEINSVQTVTDKMTQGMGLAWAPDMPGVAMPWPPESLRAGETTLNLKNADNLQSQAQSVDIVTSLTYRYAADWASGKPTRSMTLEGGSIAAYGRRNGDLAADWLQSASSAEAHAKRWLAWYGAAVWTIEADTAVSVSVGEQIGIDHPYSSQSSGVVIGSAGAPLSKAVTMQSSELNAGEITIKSRSSGVNLDAKSQQNYTYADGKLIYTVTDASGAPIVRALVTLDNTTQRYTDNAGVVQFTTGRGTHTLTIEAQGFVTQTVQVVL